MDMDYLTAFRNLLNMHFAVEKVSVFMQRNSISPKTAFTMQRSTFWAKALSSHQRPPCARSQATAGQLRQTRQGISFELGFGEPTNFNQFFKKMQG
ncbi:MAG: hypothetical protein IPN20_15035 [Haliscomenobacter sp.]|nr:hypothetical protein [Haliscomenobacter sp.]